MTIAVAVKNAMLAVRTITHVSLHSAAPGSNGSNGELPIPRGVVVFAAPKNGRLALTADVIILVNDPATITHIAYWSAEGFVLSREIAPVQIINPTNFTLKANDTYIEI